jgi:hypothetical protein
MNGSGTVASSGDPIPDDMPRIVDKGHFPMGHVRDGNVTVRGNKERRVVAEDQDEIDIFAEPGLYGPYKIIDTKG